MSGRVQGVSFRASTVEEASKYPALEGFVRNLADGRVEVLAQGDAREVLALIAWCKEGPSSAKVTTLEVREEAPKDDLEPFRMLRSTEG